MSNLATIQDSVREEVKESIMKVLPKEVIDEIVKQTFENEIKKAMQEETKRLFAENYRNEVFKASQVMFNSEETTEVVKNMMQEAGKSFFDGMIKRAMNQVMDDFRNNLYNY